MPLINWTAGDVLQGKVADAGVYPIELASYDGPKASKSEKGINLFLTFRVTDGKWINKEFTLCCSSSVRNASVLGGLQFVPMATIAFLVAAVEGKTAPEVSDGSVDIDNYLHRALAATVAVEISDGKPVNTITLFHPAGYEKQGPTF